MSNFSVNIKCFVLSLILSALSFCLSALSYSADVDQAIVHYNQGYDYYKKGEYDKAIKELDSSLKFDPNNENAYYGLGNCYYRKQVYEKALDGYNKAIEINPDFANAHYGLGTAYSALRKTDEADREFTIYRKLKAGQGQTAGSVVGGGKKTKSRKKKKVESGSSPIVEGSASRAGKSRSGSRGREPSVKSRSVGEGLSFKGLSPKKGLKDILTIPGIKSPGNYMKALVETWHNSYIGKVFIGIIGFVVVTQIWLVIVAFQCVLLWRMRWRLKTEGKNNC